MGWLNIYAAVYNEEHTNVFDISQRYGKQLIWISLALLIAFVVLIIDSRFYALFSYPFYGFMMIALVTVLLFGREVNGARSWFQIGSFRLQPAEFAKLAANLALAKYLSTFNIKIHKLKTMVIIGAIIFTPAALIILQNDTGSALVYFSFFFVLYREGLSGKFLFIGLLLATLFVATLLVDKAILLLSMLIITLLLYWFLYRKIKDFGLVFGGIASILLLIWGFVKLLKFDFPIYSIGITTIIISTIIAFVFIYKKKLHNAGVILLFLIGSIVFTSAVNYIFNDVLGKHQRTRINVLLGIETDIYGAGYNVNQSKIAIGSGGFSGKGFLQGTQTKYDFVPEQSTDFIFCTIGEEWGFLGSTFVISIFVLFLLRLIFLAERQKSNFSRIFGYGVALIFFFHFIINIGMTIGLAPVIGIPLPFFSYGGSSLWSFSILLFVFIRLDANRMELFG